MIRLSEDFLRCAHNQKTKIYFFLGAESTRNGMSFLAFSCIPGGGSLPSAIMIIASLRSGSILIPFSHLSTLSNSGAIDKLALVHISSLDAVI